MINSNRACTALDQSDATPSLDDLLSPKGPYRLRVDEPLGEGDQLINGQWWKPQYGCDSLADLLDLIRSRILPHLRPPVEGIDVPGLDGDWLNVNDLCIAEGVEVGAGARLLRRYQQARPAEPAEPDERIELWQVEMLASVMNSVSEGSDCDSEEVER